MSKKRSRTVLKLGIISDLHCLHSSSDGEESKSSFLYTDQLPYPESKHPISALIKLIKQQNIETDYLLCPGDITHKVDKQGLITGLNYLRQVNDEINSKDLIISTGNHDIDTFNLHKNLPGSLSILKNTSKSYPTNNDDLNESYWKNGFYLKEYDDLVVLNINTCHNLHKPEDLDNIILDLGIIEDIGERISSANLNSKKPKIVLMHHHPIKHSNIDEDLYPDRDVLGNGDILIEKLKPLGFNLIIHGHKHWGRLKNYDGVDVFCSGSFSCTLNVSDTAYINLFHVIELINENGKMTGRIKTWDFSPSFGWSNSTNALKFPHITGFGVSKAINILEEEVIELFSECSGTVSKDFKELTDIYAHFNFLSHDNLVKLEGRLKEKKIVFNPSLVLGAEKIIKYE